MASHSHVLVYHDPYKELLHLLSLCNHLLSKSDPGSHQDYIVAYRDSNKKDVHH